MVNLVNPSNCCYNKSNFAINMVAKYNSNANNGSLYRDPQNIVRHILWLDNICMYFELCWSLEQDSIKQEAGLLK